MKGLFGTHVSLIGECSGYLEELRDNMNFNPVTYCCMVDSHRSVKVSACASKYGGSEFDSRDRDRSLYMCL